MLLTLMIVGAIGAMTIKSSPIAAPQPTVSSGVAGAAPVPQESSTATNTQSTQTASLRGATTSSGASFQIPAGSFIVPAPTGKQSTGSYEDDESHSGTSSGENE
jgi:hypothetical protein